VSAEMVGKAKELYGIYDFRCIDNASQMICSDYTVASGIFNVKMGYPDDKWLDEYVVPTINSMNDKSSHGFAFNLLTSYSDAEKMEDYLFYADPCFLFDYCKRNFSRNVALLHDYELYEFTMVVRK
jgi:hypothetical protein